MRVVALALVVMGCALPAMAGEAVTVAALRKILTAQETAHKRDSAIAQELSKLALTEELTARTLTRIMADVQPGPQTALALELLADASALLPPPADEVPAEALPDMAAQRAIFRAAMNYVANTQRHLPDFLAQRQTRSFNDSPTVVGHSGYAPITGMRAVGTFQRDIAYRDGKEVPVVEKAVARKNPGPTGLATWGEFGPVLAIVLTDSLKGRVTWSRWEDGASGRVSVFRYEVPKAASHYNVDFCCAWQELNIESETPESMAYHGKPGYHGELTIDPASGAIERVTLEAELGSTEVIRRAAISVEYGSVEIGVSKYICPTRSVAISEDMNRPGKTIGGSTAVTRINETLFLGYHRFGSTARMLAEGPENPPSTVAEKAETQAELSGNIAAKSANTSETEEHTEESAPPAATQSANQSAAVTEAKAADAPQQRVEAATDAKSKPGAQATPVFQTTARDVVLDVVVTNGKGDAVKGLGKQDFSVSEEGTAQTVDFFERHTANDALPYTAPEMPPLAVGAVTNVPPAAEGDAVNVLLLDTLNTPPKDQANVRKQMQDFLKKKKPGTRIAIFALGAKLRFVQGFTTDSSALLAATKQQNKGKSMGSGGATPRRMPPISRSCSPCSFIRPAYRMRRQLRGPPTQGRTRR